MVIVFVFPFYVKLRIIQMPWNHEINEELWVKNVTRRPSDRYKDISGHEYFDQFCLRVIYLHIYIYLYLTRNEKNGAFVVLHISTAYTTK